MKILRFSALFLVLPQLVCAQIVSGPMVGHTTDKSSRVWVYDQNADDLTIDYWPSIAGSETSRRVSVQPKTGDRSVFIAELNGLEPETKYGFRITSKGKRPRNGSLVTAPSPQQPGKFSYAITSCMDFKQFPDQPAWDAVIEEKPAFHLLLGDNVYADSTSYQVILEHHLKQRTIGNFSKLLASVPHYATWDDHDFGPNDSHGATPGKEESLRAFQDVWANPAYGMDQTPGVFFTFGWADVQFFVMDDRYHRADERAPDSSGKSQFGGAQREWLFEQLKASRAPFKIVVNGYDIMSSKYPDEIKVIAAFISRNRISGVLFHSGDIHRNEFKQQDHGMGYPVTQITSSGIARNKTRPWAMIDIDTTLDDPKLTARFFVEEKLDGVQTVRLSELTP